MKKLSLVVFSFLLIILKSYAQEHAADEAAIKKTMESFANSWKKHDFSDMKDYMTPDCNWINIVGMQWKGLKEIQFAHQFFIAGMFKNVVPQTVDVNIRLISPTVAIAYWRSHMPAFYPPDGVDHGSNKHQETDDLATIVLIKQTGKWFITSGQNASVNSEAAASNPVLNMNK